MYKRQAGESAYAVNSQPLQAVWPWAVTAQSQAPATSYTTQPLGWPNVYWPSPTQQFCGWSTPYAAPVTPGTSGGGQGKNTGQHPSVPNTGYNTVPITAMPYGDYTMQLGDHLTPAVKEKI